MAEQKPRTAVRRRRAGSQPAQDEAPKRQRGDTDGDQEQQGGLVSGLTGQAEEAKGAVGQATEEAKGAVGQTAGGVQDVARGAQQTVRGELGSIVREAALEVLGPVARKATTAAAKYAVTQGPQLAKDKVAPKIAEAGGAGQLAKGALSKVGDVGSGVLSKVGIGGGGAGAPTGTGRGRRLPVQESVDVAVPLETAYHQFTQFEEFPRFMHRVEKVEQRDDAHVVWHENIWGIRRQWEAEITEQQPDERIVWKSTGGTQTTGVVTFHRLSDRLTRIEVSLDFQPQGLFEKTASGMRMSRRALKSDLMRFKAFIEMRGEETGAWAGAIEEGEVVEPEEAEAQPEEEPEGEAEEEPEAEAEEEEELEEEAAEEEPVAEEEPEDEEAEDRRGRIRRRPAARPARTRRSRP